MDEIKVVFGIIGVIITILAPLPYIRDVIKGKTRPHVITWFIWTVLVVIAAIIQIIGNGGLGAAIFGFTALMNLLIFGLSLRQARTIITRFDFFILGLTCLALLLWAITNSPLVSIILVTIATMLGGLPTYRKSFSHPEQETVSLYFFSAIKQVCGIIALASYNMLTLLLPVCIFFSNAALVGLIEIRRRQLK